MPAMNDDVWPALPYDEWKDTYATLHMWSQVIGKVAVVLAPPVNHSWGVSLQVTARGLSTRPLPHGSRSFTMAFSWWSTRPMGTAGCCLSNHAPSPISTVMSWPCSRRWRCR